MRKIFLAFAACMLLLSCNMKNKDKQSQPEVVVEEETVMETVEMTRWNLVAADSDIHWKGFKPGGEHFGILKASQGYVVLTDGMLSGGEFRIDMKSILAQDLKGDMKAKLEKHLASPDFFDVEKYPTASFAITNVEKSDNTMYPVKVSGNISIKDSTRNIHFLAKYEMRNDTLIAESDMFKLDRTEFGVNHMSKNIFKELKDMFVQDDIELQIKAKFVK